MADSKFELQVFCTEHNLIRSTYFSNTYRASFELDGITKSWDITHISLPFDEEKERLLQARFGIPDGELFEFYKRFAKCVQNSMAVVKYINDIPLEEQSQNQDGTVKRDPARAVKSSAALYKYKRIIKKGDKHGSDVYLVTEPLDTFVGSEFCTGTAISLNNLLSFAARATQIINGFAYYGFHIGAFDLDTIFLQNIDGKKFFTFGSFLYAGFDQDRLPMNWKFPAWPDIKELPTLPANADQSVKEGGAPSLVSDMHSLVALLWVVLSGKSYRDAPDYEETPRYAPAELLEVLKQGRDSDDPDTLRVMSKKFHAVMRSIRRQELPDTIIHMAAPPDYLSEYLAKGENESEDASQAMDTSSEVGAEKAQADQSEPKGTKHQEAADVESDKGDSQQEKKEQTSGSEEPVQAEIIAEVVAVTVPTVLAAKAVSEQLGVEESHNEGADNIQPPEGEETGTDDTPQETLPEPPQMAKMPAIATDTRQADKSHTDSSEKKEDASKQDVVVPKPPSAEPETSAPPEAEAHIDAAHSSEEGSHEEMPKEPKEEPEADSAEKSPESIGAVQQTPQPVEPVQEQAQVHQSEGTSHKPADEQKESKGGDVVSPVGMNSHTVNQPSMFQGPIFIPVPYGQPGGQQGFMAVYPPQMMTGQPGGDSTEQPAAAPQTVPVPAAQFKPTQQTAATGPTPQTAEPKPQPVLKTPAPEAKSETTSVSTQAPAPKPAQKVIRRTVTTYRKPKKQSKVGTFVLVLFLIAILTFLGMCAAQYMGYDVPYNIPLIDELRGVADFTVTPESVTLHVGEEVILSSSEGCTLSSSDHNVAVVSDTGHVRGVGTGTCTITARASSSSSVVRIPVTVLQGSD